MVNFFLLVSWPNSVQGQAQGNVDGNRPFRENVTLPLDSNLLKKFGTVDDFLADQRWNEAVAILQEIAQTESKSLVLVQPGKVGGTATYLNVATRCSVLLSRIPLDGRASYRQKVDPQAKRWFENWQRSRDEAELLRVVRQTFMSSYADDALLALGEIAWDRCEFSSARSWWERLIPLAANVDAADYPTVLRYPDTDLPIPEILSRIILCSIMEREFDRAEDELLQFAERYPVADGWICGRHGRLANILKQSLSDARDWKVAHVAAEVATFGLSPERYQQISESIDVGALRWVRSLPPNVLKTQPGRLPFQFESLSYHPVVYDADLQKIVLVNDQIAIRAWNLMTGEPAWKTDHEDSAVIYPAFLDDHPTNAERACVGVPHYTMTIAGNRLYARMGSPITCSSDGELWRDAAPELVCLDLAQEGKLVWKVAAHELIPKAPTWRFEGTPLILAGRAYVVICRRHPQLELTVACLDATDGRLLWIQPVGAFRVSVDDSNNRVSHLLLTAGGGQIFLSTDIGAIVALDPHDGRLQWALTYESRSLDLAGMKSGSTGDSLVPPLYHRGKLFIAPADSSSAYCVEADSGRISWIFPYARNVRQVNDMKQINDKRWRHLLGVVQGGRQGRLIVSGNSLWSIDIESNKLVWSLGDGALSRGAKGQFGRGLIVGDQILLPMRESIEFFDHQSGELTRTVPLKPRNPAQQGGNLTVASGMLLVAQPNQLSAYGEFSQLKERIENELTQRPEEPGVKIQLAELDWAEGDIGSATERIRGLLKQLDSSDVCYTVARQKLSGLLRESGKVDFREGKLEEARDHWVEALSLESDQAKQIELIFELSQVDEALGHPEKAVAVLQRILIDERLASVIHKDMNAGRVAANTISRIINEHGHDAYREIEAAVSDEFDVLKKGADRAGLHRLIAKYPHSIVASKAQKLLVQFHHKAGEYSEAFAVQSDIRRNAVDDRAFVEATLSTIELLEQAGYRNATNRYWLSLANRSSDDSVIFAGTKHDLNKLVCDQLGKSASSRQIEPNQIERTWSNNLPDDAIIIIPSGESVSAEHASILVCFKQAGTAETWAWQCIDWRSGQTRWQVTESEPIQAAVWTPVHLLIGTLHGWNAHVSENGRRVWRHRSEFEVTSYALKTDDNADDVALPCLFDVGLGLQILDPNNGNQVARLKPPGQLSSIIGFTCPTLLSKGCSGNVSDQSESRGTQSEKDRFSDSVSLFLQTIKPTRNWRATASSPRGQWSLDEIFEKAEPWQSAPLGLGNRLIGVTKDQYLVGYRIEVLHHEYGADEDCDNVDETNTLSEWKYRNFSFANANPFVFVAGGKLLAAVDGLQLALFDKVTGLRKWSSGLADFPIKSPADQVCTDNDFVFATSQGILRSISINDGKTRFESYLGGTTQQWKTTIAWTNQIDQTDSKSKSINNSSRITVVALWPINAVDANRYSIRLCDGKTGRLTQVLRLDSEPLGIMIDADGIGVIWTTHKAIGIRFVTTKVPLETARNSQD